MHPVGVISPMNGAVVGEPHRTYDSDDVYTVEYPLTPAAKSTSAGRRHATVVRSALWLGIGRDLVVGSLRAVVQLYLVGLILAVVFRTARWYWVLHCTRPLSSSDTYRTRPTDSSHGRLTA